MVNIVWSVSLYVIKSKKKKNKNYLKKGLLMLHLGVFFLGFLK